MVCSPNGEVDYEMDDDDDKEPSKVNLLPGLKVGGEHPIED